MIGKMEQTVELFAGTGSFSKIAREREYRTFTVELDPSFSPNLVADISKLRPADIPDCRILWASPPCTAFSVASLSHHWISGRIPKSEGARLGLLLLERTIEMIAAKRPEYWFIENPRGIMRNVIDDLFRKHGISSYSRQTVSYCQYGDTRMKPTDIWTNLQGWHGKCCRNGDSCHTPAPRGSKTPGSTQGMKGAKDRSVVPPALLREIFDAIEGGSKQGQGTLMEAPSQ